MMQKKHAKVKENKSMRKRISISLDGKIASSLEAEAGRRGISFSQLVSQYLEHYIALRNRVFITLQKDFTKEELTKLKEVSQKLLENPVSKDSVLYEIQSDKELYEKVKNLSECEINLLFSYLENAYDVI